jgi:hypothetical protein
VTRFNITVANTAVRMWLKNLTCFRTSVNVGIDIMIYNLKYTKESHANIFENHTHYSTTNFYML